jgi:hypothetical protein
VNGLQLIPVEGNFAYTIDYSADVAEGVTVSSIVWSVSPSLTLAGQVDALGSARSTIRVSGAEHGTCYLLQAIATLSSGEVIPKDITLRGFNGA